MRDVTKILSESELIQIREMLRTMPAPTEASALGGDYPRMLFHPDWYQYWVVTKEGGLDHLAVKKAQEVLRTHVVVVHNFEDEEDYLTDGWTSDPNELVTKAKGKDPRVPDGREGRVAAKDARIRREQELIELRRRYAQLTGRRIVDDEMLNAPPVSETVAEDPEPETAALDETPMQVPAGLAREAVKRNAKRATAARA